MKEKFELPPIAQTLFIPLAVRANEAADKNAVLNDSMAADIFCKCDTKDIVLNGGGISSHGILARTVTIDKEVDKLLATGCNTVVINLGAGMDTRYYRLKNKASKWYDLDLPEVIELRKKFFSQSDGLYFISKSITDFSWINEIDYCEKGNVIIIAEGLLMYFDKNTVQEIFSRLTASFNGANMLFDVVDNYFVGKKISSKFLWGISNLNDIKSMNNKISIIQAFSTGDILLKKQPFVCKFMNKNRSRILHIKLEK